MHSTRGHISLKPRLHPLQNRTTVGVFIETQYLEKHCLLKRSEHVCHNGYIVGIKLALSTTHFSSGYFELLPGDVGNLCSCWEWCWVVAQGGRKRRPPWCQSEWHLQEC
jgi:hypothetical protein